MLSDHPQMVPIWDFALLKNIPKQLVRIRCCVKPFSSVTVCTSCPLRKEWKSGKSPDRVNFQYRPKILFSEISSLCFLGNWSDVDWHLLLYKSLEIYSTKSFWGFHPVLNLLSLKLKELIGIRWQHRQRILQMWMQHRKSFRNGEKKLFRDLLADNEIPTVSV